MDQLVREAKYTPELLDDRGGDLMYLFVYCYYCAQATWGSLFSDNLTSCNEHNSHAPLAEYL